MTSGNKQDSYGQYFAILKCVLKVGPSSMQKFSARERYLLWLFANRI